MDLKTEKHHKKDSAIEMVPLKKPEENRGGNSALDSDELDSESKCEISAMQYNFYGPIFNMLFAFILIGVPFNFCFAEAPSYLKCPAQIRRIRLLTSRTAKIYTILVSVLSHLVLVLALGFLLQHLRKPVIDEDTLFYFLVFLGILSGVIAIDMVWLNRNSLSDVLQHLFDYWQLLEQRPKYKNLFMENLNTLSRYRIKFSVIGVVSWAMFGTLIALISLLIVVTILDQPSELQVLPFLYGLFKQSTTQTDAFHYSLESRIISLVSYYSIFFFLSKAFVLVSFIWVLQFEVEHLNLFLRNLITNSSAPEIEAVEIIKLWYSNLLNKVNKLDRFSQYYTGVYFGLLFIGLFYSIDRLIEIFKNIYGVPTIQFASNLALATVCFTFLMYALKQFAEIHTKSSKTRSILYDFVLHTKPEQRSTGYFEEFEFVIQGLLCRPAVFTIFGQIQLTNSFMVHIILIVYSYGLLFHKLIHPTK